MNNIRKHVYSHPIFSEGIVRIDQSRFLARPHVEDLSIDYIQQSWLSDTFKWFGDMCREYLDRTPNTRS